MENEENKIEIPVKDKPHTQDDAGIYFKERGLEFNEFINSVLHVFRPSVPKWYKALGLKGNNEYIN